MRRMLIPLICITLALLISALAWSALPDQVPSHWNIRGEVDGYFDKTAAVAFTPAIMLALTALFALLSTHDPLRPNEQTRNTFVRFGNYVIVFMLVIHALIVAFALGWRVDVVRGIMLMEGFLFAAIGNEMGRLQPNSWAGIRTPWTLRDEDVWRRTHRNGGRWMFVAGVIDIVIALVLPANWLMVGLIPIFVAVIATLVYSYVIAQQKSQQQG